jgi:hypothetical protein
MTHAGYILSAWIVSAGAVAAYCARVLQRGRRLSRDVAPDRRRWMTTDDAERR